LFFTEFLLKTKEFGPWLKRFNILLFVFNAGEIGRHARFKIGCFLSLNVQVVCVELLGYIDEFFNIF
jgi:hypothetical protein